DLLESIEQRLTSGHDVASFRSACSSWRAAVPFATFGPLLLLPFDSDRVGFYYVPEKKVLSKTLPDVRGKMACGSSCGWLALMDEAVSVTLLNPFAGARALALSSRQQTNMSRRRPHRNACIGSTAGGSLHPTNGYGDADTVGRAIKLQDMRDVFFRVIVLSAPPDTADRECMAMAMLGCFMEVAFYWVGVDSAWTLLDTKLEFSVGSIVHCQDKFLAIDCTGEISVCSSNAAGATPTTMLLPSLSPPVGLCHRSYLESNGELNIVRAMVSMFHETHSFTYSSAIYKCNLHDRTPEWSRVRDISDQTLFVSKYFNESFSGTNVSKYKENKIYMF
ncbi:putative F-box protein At5g55150, partial [Miscanthus floridulus]|uniref:putative F-box protein At5g55150 n=1 Tax=Miscanthus floridulus TaxID=154761 RepID=UPI00345B0B0E